MVGRIQKGDTEAFDLLFEKYKDEAVRTAYLITGNRSICEDIAQETFISCYRNIGVLKQPKTFRTWFYRILTRTAWKYAKSAGREVTEENIVERADEAAVNASVEQHRQSLLNQMLYTEISRLDSKQKIVIVLFYFNGLSIKEIAAVLKCFEGTVKSRLYTARRNLKRGLETLEADGEGVEFFAEKGVV